MNHPLRIKRKNFFQRLPKNASLVGRPSRWGNPYRVEFRASDKWVVVRTWADGDMTHARAATKNEAAAEACKLFRFWLTLTPEGREVLAKARVELKGRRLACYCSLDAPCHADVLAELVNGDAE